MKILKYILEFIIVAAVLAGICLGVIYLYSNRSLPWEQSVPKLVTEIDGVKLYKIMDDGEWIYFTNNGLVHKQEGK